jgi:hypothetical protein
VESWAKGKVQLWAREVLQLEEADVGRLKTGGSQLLTTSREARGLSVDALAKVQLAIDSGNYWADQVCGLCGTDYFTLRCVCRPVCRL